jgi:hypothetical protein
MIIEKIAPTFTVAAPRIVSRSQRRRFTSVGRHPKFTSSPIANIDVSTHFPNWKRNVDSPKIAIAVQRRHNLV